MINCLSSSKFANLLFINVQIGNVNAIALFDTGAAGIRFSGRPRLAAGAGVQASAMRDLSGGIRFRPSTASSCQTERLISAGLDPSVKSFFPWLGMTCYLSAETIDTMLSALSSLCADGSTLVFDYPDENFFAASEKRVHNTIMMAKAGGEPMQSKFGEVDG